MSILSAARRLSDGVNQAAIVLCVACVLAMLAISFTGFLYTLFTGDALSWTYSLARLFLPWIGLISITIALHSGEHVAMTLLVRLLPMPLVRAAAVATLLVMAFFALLMIWYGWGYFANASQVYMVSDNIQISYRWTAITVPLTGMIFLLHLVQGFSLLEHFADENALIDEALADSDRETRP
ncbi:TRAP-type C4-dicarboxylate transport system, small permease component [Modicisalibacter ilicicola DSM 19980]|uniref:TRAP transporter small permease protein n=1 Tax=Modicisalibacter ilicicola DSM 19980 TaxID=1121942 RepID=A0A1M5D598_9GAMM|nr:TRAP transporter small permease subunit [Halomonas ilicicola]SHF62164.1 TRAP-type C4-dicarboxylate transport system, small permease component [Halomonas ilicicola DSM 19980]